MADPQLPPRNDRPTRRSFENAPPPTQPPRVPGFRDIAADAATTIVTRLIGTAPSGDAARSAVADVLKG